MWMWVRLPLRVVQARHQPSDSPTLLTPLSPPFGYHCLHETTHRQPDNTPTSDAATSGPRTTLRETGLENLHQDSWAPPDVSRKKRLLRTPQTPHISGRSTALRSRERVCCLLARGSTPGSPWSGSCTWPGSGERPAVGACRRAYRSSLACLYARLPVLLETAVPDPRDPHPPVLDRDRLGSDAALSRQLGLEE